MPLIQKGAEITGPALDKIVQTVMSAGKLISQSGRRVKEMVTCLLYTSPSPRDRTRSRMPSSA